MLRFWLRAEFGVFKIFISFVLAQKKAEAGGNPFAQFIHDAGTLANHHKYQAFAFQFIMAGWEKNMVVAWGFPRSTSGTDVDVAKLAKDTLLL